MMERRAGSPTGSTSLIDILDRVLDKGLVVAGDIRVALANVELLTIQIRLLVCSIDKAQEIGLDWWRRDSFLSGGSTQESLEAAELRARVEALERQLAPPSELEPENLPPARSGRHSTRQRQTGTRRKT